MRLDTNNKDNGLKDFPLCTVEIISLIYFHIKAYAPRKLIHYIFFL